MPRLIANLAEEAVIHSLTSQSLTPIDTLIIEKHEPQQVSPEIVESMGL